MKSLPLLVMSQKAPKMKRMTEKCAEANTGRCENTVQRQRRIKMKKKLRWKVSTRQEKVKKKSGRTTDTFHSENLINFRFKPEVYAAKLCSFKPVGHGFGICGHARTGIGERVGGEEEDTCPKVFTTKAFFSEGTKTSGKEIHKDVFLT